MSARYLGHMLWGAPWWDALSAIGTVLAVVAALGLAWAEGSRAKRAELALGQERSAAATAARRATASLVAAWAENSYVPSADGSHYQRFVRVHLSNASAEPVFDVHLVLGAEVPPVQLGPLSVPTPIPVLAAGHERSWDVTAGFLARSEPYGLVPTDPVARVWFTDANGVRWLRDFDGTLADTEGPAAGQLFETDADEGARQIGDIESPWNPLNVALLFFHIVTGEAPTASLIQPLVAPTARAWSSIGDAELASIGGTFREFGLASHVWYPTPRVAYVRLVREDAQSTAAPAKAGFVGLPMQIMTLVFLADVGWRVFSVGPAATAPDWIEFPKGELHRSVRK